VRSLVVVAVLATTLVLPAASPAHASSRCDPLVFNIKTNPLRLSANGALLIEYHVTVSWCTAPNGIRVYSPRRTHGPRVTTAGLLAGWRFDRVLSEQRGYYTYNGVPDGGYYVKTRVNFVRCVPAIVPVCTNQSGWLTTYVHYDRTAAAARGWD
jgi:hypothetical protein